MAGWLAVGKLPFYFVAMRLWGDCCEALAQEATLTWLTKENSKLVVRNETLQCYLTLRSSCNASSFAEVRIESRLQ